MKKIKLILLILHPFFTLKSQNLKNCTCTMIQEALRTKYFAESFISSINDSIVLIDSVNSYSNCFLNGSVEKNISFVCKPFYFNPNKYDKNRNKHEVLIVKNKWIKGVCYLQFIHPYTNTSLELSLVKRRKRIFVKLISEGVF